MVTHSSALAWRVPWTEEPGGLQSMGSQMSWTQVNDQTSGTNSLQLLKGKDRRPERSGDFLRQQRGNKARVCIRILTSVVQHQGRGFCFSPFGKNN